MKVLNVFGIIFAWILSIALVIALMVTPLLVSVLDLLKPETITKVATSLLTGGATSSAKEDEMVIQTASTQGVRLTLLADGDAAAAGSQSAASSLITPEMLEGMLGVKVDESALEKVLKSDTVNDLLGAYTDDLANAIAGGESKFNADTIKKIANDNMDEIVNIIQEAVPDMAGISKDELKSQIQTAIDQNAEQIVQALPKVEDIKESLVGENPAIEIAFTVLAKKNQIKLAIVGMSVVLAIIIFFLRFPGFRGLRWLAVDLFVAGGLGGVLVAALKVGQTMILGMMASEPMVAAIVKPLLTTLSNGMLWRTIVIVVVGGVSLAGYIVLKKVRKVAAEEEVSFQALMEEVEMADAEEQTVVAEEA